MTSEVSPRKKMKPYQKVLTLLLFAAIIAVSQIISYFTHGQHTMASNCGLTNSAQLIYAADTVHPGSPVTVTSQSENLDYRNYRVSLADKAITITDVATSKVVCHYTAGKWQQ
jgi:hypothetical protein